MKRSCANRTLHQDGHPVGPVGDTGPNDLNQHRKGNDRTSACNRVYEAGGNTGEKQQNDVGS